jgi:hypothetical protein
MAVDKDRRLMKVRPSRGLRPFVNYYLRMLAWAFCFLMSCASSIVAAIYSYADSNAVLTTVFLYGAWWFFFRSLRPFVNSVIGLTILSVPRNDLLRLESVILHALPFVQNSFMDIVDVSYLEMELSGVRAQLGFSESAEQYARSARDRILQRLPYLTEQQVYPLNGFVGMLHYHHAATLCQVGRHVEAEKVAMEAQSYLRDFKGGLSSVYAGMHRIAPAVTLGWIQMHWNELEQARSTFEEAAIDWEESMKDTTYGDMLTENRQANIIMSLAAVSAKEDKIDDSLEYFEAFKQLLRVATSDVRMNHIEDLNLLCHEYSRNGKLDEAEVAIGIAYGAGETIPFNPYAMRTLDVYEGLLRQTNRESEIEDMRLRVKPIALVEN